ARCCSRKRRSSCRRADRSTLAPPRGRSASRAAALRSTSQSSCAGAAGSPPAGAYVLTVAELLDSKGGRLAGLVELPFTVAPIAGELPKDHRVEHAVRLEVGELGVTRLS